MPGFLHRSIHLSGELFAGVATALIFYAEYVGLGSQLGAVWLGQGVGNLGYGNVLAFAAGTIGCAFAVLSPGAYLAGPRAASVVVLMSSLIYLSSHFGLDLKAQSAVAAMAMASAAVTVFLCSGPLARLALASLPTWLMHAFNFATAVFIVSDGVARAVIDCQQVDATLAWAVFACSVTVGVLWSPICEIAAVVLRRAWLARLTPLGTIAAVALAWLAYEHSALSHSDGLACGRFGTQALRVDVLLQRAASIWDTLAGGFPVVVVMGAIACGVGAGFALLLESSSAFFAADGQLLPSHTRLMRMSALSNGVGACAGVGPISYSASRTQAIRLFGGRTRLSAVMHGASLVLLALLAGPWMGQVPQVAIGVVLALVGLNMVTPGMCRMWRDAYAPAAANHLVHGVAGFWLSVVTALAVGSALAGFLVGLAAYAWWNFARSLKGP